MRLTKPHFETNMLRIDQVGGGTFANYTTWPLSVKMRTCWSETNTVACAALCPALHQA